MENIDKENGEWFVVNTLSGHENKVKNSLEREISLAEEDIPIYEVLIPTEQVSEIRQGKKITSTRKFFPGYILLRMDLYKEKLLDKDLWHFVKNIQSVIGFVGGGDNPFPLSPDEAEDLIDQITEKSEKANPKILYSIGETLKINDGAFENFDGIVEDVDSEKGKIKLMVSIFGRLTPVELEFWQVGRE